MYREGSFARVPTEVTAFDLVVIGEIPTALEGRCLRNGPNPIVWALGGTTWASVEADLVSELFRFTGGSAAMHGNEMQRIVRDTYAVQAHLMVPAVTYEQYGQILLGMTEGGALS